MGCLVVEVVFDVLCCVVVGMVLFVYVCSYCIEFLCWNEVILQFFMDFGMMLFEDCNLLVYMFLYVNVCECFVEWENEVWCMLVKFCVVYDLYVDDLVFVVFVDWLCISSCEFDIWWCQYEVCVQCVEYKLICMFGGKVVCYDYIGLLVMEDLCLCMVLYVLVEDGV